MNIRHQRQRIESAKAYLAFVLAFTVLIISCRPSSNSSNDTNTQAVVSSTTPPFSTKEPERYRATRIVTFTPATTGATRITKAQTNTVLIVRDGDQRREEYEVGSLGTIVYLESTAGRFVMLPQAKIYGSRDDADVDAGLTKLKVESETMSPDFLLNESTVSSEYQKLGEEVRSGRMTTKYRVLSRSRNPPITSETLIWVDQTLGMPIASQLDTNSANGSTRVLMELHDISTEVEPGVFALPADYRKVAVSEILSMVRAAGGVEGSPAAK